MTYRSGEHLIDHRVLELQSVEASGRTDEALISYRHWLTLTDDEAVPRTVIKVQDLEAQLHSVLAADTRP